QTVAQQIAGLQSGDLDAGIVPLPISTVCCHCPGSQGIFGLLLTGKRKKPARISPKSPINSATSRRKSPDVARSHSTYRIDTRRQSNHPPCKIDLIPVDPSGLFWPVPRE